MYSMLNDMTKFVFIFFLTLFLMTIESNISVLKSTQAEVMRVRAARQLAFFSSSTNGPPETFNTHVHMSSKLLFKLKSGMFNSEIIEYLFIHDIIIFKEQ